MIGGAEVPVKTDTFQNDFERFQSRDDVLTLLIHLGYLTYDAEKETVHIPNEEVRSEFRNFLGNDRPGKHWARLIGRSRKLLRDTFAGDTVAVAGALNEIRQEHYAPQFYNNEQALRAVIKYAFLAAEGQYVKIEEIPARKGIADIAYIPASMSKLPPMVVELKWNRSAGGAIAQIREKNYTAALSLYAGKLLLVGINYDEKTGMHTCVIEKA